MALPQFNWKVVYGAKLAALYDLGSGNIYSVNKSGAIILEMLMQGLALDNIAKKLSAEHDITAEIAHATVKEFIDELNQLELIGIKESPNYCLNVNSQTPSSENTFRQVWCELTGDCNLQCIHCYASAGESHIKGLTTDNWVNVVQQICELGCDNLQLTGGEPFLRRDLFNFVDIAVSKGTKVEIYSNLTLCPVDKLMKYEGYISVATTVLGPTAEIHDNITGVKGSFSQTIGVINQLVKSGIPIRVGVIVMAQNAQYVDETLSFIRSLGVKQYGTDYMRLVGRGDTNREHSKSALSAPSLAYPILPTITHSNFERNHEYNPCWGRTLAIKPDGTLMPCIFGRSISLGNILNDSLVNLIKQERIQNLWKITLDDVETCRDCEFRYACQDCRPLALYEGDGLFSRAPRCNYNPYAGL
jgi:radical SAM protein with 4Fe4S-binding SPASM domain